MAKQLVIICFFICLLSACSMGSVKVYKMNNDADLFNKDIDKKLKKEEPLETAKLHWFKDSEIDITKYCGGKPSYKMALRQYSSIWGFKNNFALKFVCKD